MGHCIVTHTCCAVQNAHIIPSADWEWFERNGMSKYGTHHGIDESTNKVKLRNDLHDIFDNHQFVVVPKNGTYVVHGLVAHTLCGREFCAQFHNRPVF